MTDDRIVRRKEIKGQSMIDDTRIPSEEDSSSSSRRRHRDAGEGAPTFRMGRIDAVHEQSSGVTVQLFHGKVRGPSLATIDLFPSVAWAKAHIGRWVILNGNPAEARVVPGPSEIINHAVDPETKELVLRCMLCKREMGRLPESIARKGARPVIDQVKLILQAHLPNFHPEIMDVFK